MRTGVPLEAFVDPDRSDLVSDELNDPRVVDERDDGKHDGGGEGGQARGRVQLLGVVAVEADVGHEGEGDVQDPDVDDQEGGRIAEHQKEEQGGQEGDHSLLYLKQRS